MSILLVVDPGTFEVNARGSIIGEIYFRFEDLYFPVLRWTDFAVSVLSEWMGSVADLANGKTESIIVSFMEGPYEVSARSCGSSVVVRGLIRGTSESVCVAVVSLGDLYKNALECGLAVVKRCEELAGQNNDYVDMISSIEKLKSSAGPADPTADPNGDSPCN
jgi:hypothetical protein